MATKYAIETVYKLIDNITAPLDKIGVKGKVVGRTLKNEFTKTEQQLANVGAKLKNFAKGAALAGVALVGIGVGVATKQFIDYDAAVTGATAKFKDLDITSADYKDNLKAVGKVARDVAAVTEFNAVDTAGALDKMAMAGFDKQTIYGVACRHDKPCYCCRSRFNNGSRYSYRCTRCVWTNDRRRKSA